MKKGPSLLVRFTIYPFVVFIFAAIVAFTAFSAAGYDIKFENGKITTKETGLIIVNTRPGEADVYLDGDLYNKKTPSFALFNLKINRVSVGEHNLKISKEGYEVWDGIVNVNPGLVTWIDYVVLVPQERKAEPFIISGEIKSAIVSHDKQRQLIYSYDEKEKINLITEVDTTNKGVEKLYEFLSQDAATYSLVSYSHDKERFLLRKTLENKHSYIVYESKKDGQLWNLSTLFGLDPDSLAFSPHNHNKLYILKDSNIREIDISSKTQGAIIANEVSSIHYDPHNLLFIQESDENHSLWSFSSSNEKVNIVKALPASKKYVISYLDKYEDYLILAVDEKDLIIYSNGVSNPTLETISGDVTSYTLSPSEERIGYKKGDDLIVYDLEKEGYYTVLSGKKIEKITWMYNDGNLLYLEENGKLSMVNFTGNYNNFLFNIEKSLPIISAPESAHIFFGTLTEDEKIVSSVFSFSF